MLGIIKNLFMVAVLFSLVSSCPLHHYNRSLINIKKQMDHFAAAKDIVTISPGKIAFIRFPYFGPYEEEFLICDEKKIPFSVIDEQSAFAYIAQSYFDTKEEFNCILSIKETEEKKLLIPIVNIQVKQIEYPEEKLLVDNKRVELSDEDEKRVDEERINIDNLLQNKSSHFLVKTHFSSPLSSKLTSFYGTKRIFNNNHQSQHLGNDFRAAIGTPIPSANAGTVVFAGDLFYGGNTVIIDHGLGIFTSYSHLSKLLVAPQQTIDKGHIVGLSGMTGRVNGPHLHWGTLVHGHWVDGFSLIEASKKNFSEEKFHQN